MKKCTRFVGLDDSKNSIDVAVASEAGPCGDGVYRELLALGANCIA